MQIELEREAALVLFELLASRDEELVRVLKLEAAERNALWSLEGALERVLVELFSPEYRNLLANARRILVERGGK